MNEEKEKVQRKLNIATDELKFVKEDKLTRPISVRNPTIGSPVSSPRAFLPDQSGSSEFTSIQKAMKDEKSHNIVKKQYQLDFKRASLAEGNRDFMEKQKDTLICRL
jgi:hypothetical protein